MSIFINTYGKQLRAVCFFKNKLVSEWTLKRIDSLWNMSQNISLKWLEISGFTKLKTLVGIEKAPNNEEKIKKYMDDFQRLIQILCSERSMLYC